MDRVSVDRRKLLTGVLGAGAAAMSVSASQARMATPDQPASSSKPKPLAGSVGVVLSGWKRTAFLKAPDGMSQAAYADRWAREHAARLQRVPGMKSVILNTVIKERSQDKDFDLVTEMFFEDEAAYLRAYDGATGACAQEARVNPPALVMLGREVGVKELDKRRPQSNVKRFIVIQRKDELTPEELQRKWRDEHAWSVVLNGNVRKYFIHVADHDLGPRSVWDGYAEMWWDNWDDVAKRSSFNLPSPGTNAKISLNMFLEPRSLA